MKISDVTDYWFHPKNKDKWFNPTREDDEEITSLFEPYLSLKMEETLGFIILYDQMVRHFNRVKPNDVNFYHQKALGISMKLLDKDIFFNPEERCFLLLPLRHTFELKYLEIVIDKIKKYVKFEEASIYQRFWRATLLSYYEIKTKEVGIEEINETITNEEIFEILDKGEKTKASPNLSKILDLNLKNEIYSSFRNTLEENSRIVISLSGGVDSMVASFICAHLRKNGFLKDVVAVMIDYGNRETCKYEVEMVKRWCQLLDISLYVLHIEHLKRKRDKDRSLYEEVTRQIRFMMYKRFENYSVILGHNLDDCEENIFTNIRKSKCYDNLRGMKTKGKENGVTILRPMINIRKEEIYKFATFYEIPYLYDSTPNWCDRGRMRKELIPFLNSFDPAFLPGLLKLSEAFSDMYRIYEKEILETFKKNKIRMEEGKIFMEVDTELDYGYAFWKDIIYSIIYEKGIKAPSNKSIRFLSNRFKKREYGKINLNTNFAIHFGKNQIEFFF